MLTRLLPGVMVTDGTEASRGLILCPPLFPLLMSILSVLELAFPVSSLHLGSSSGPSQALPPDQLFNSIRVIFLTLGTDNYTFPQ